MAYTTTAKIRLLTNLTTSDVSDDDVTNLIAQATYQVNSDLNTRVYREVIGYIDNTRQNEINGTNTTYYVKNWNAKFIGDGDNDGGVDTSDITVYQVASDGTESTLTVSSITPTTGKFVLDSAPSSGVDLYVTYEWCYRDESTPDKMVELATSLLTAAFCFEKIERGLAPMQVFGNVKLTRDMEASNRFYQRYKDLISNINSELGAYSEAPTF